MQGKRLLLAGVDGGGTKTACVVCRTDGEIVGRAVGRASNPNGQGTEAAAAALCDTLAQALAGAEGSVALFAGVAGCGAPEQAAALLESVRRRFPGINARVDSDAAIALSAAHGTERDGALAICGTGSSFFVRSSRELLRVGGWGYLFGDMGGGYAFGQMALSRALRERDGMAEPSLLARLCEERLGAPVEQAIPAIYSGGRTFIASFAPCVGEAVRQADPAALEVLRANAEAAAEAISAVLRKAGNEALPVALAGSIWREMPLFRERVAERLPGVELFLPSKPPVVGALLEAARLAGEDPGHLASQLGETDPF